MIQDFFQYFSSSNIEKTVAIGLQLGDKNCMKCSIVKTAKIVYIFIKKCPKNETNVCAGQYETYRHGKKGLLALLSLSFVIYTFAYIRMPIGNFFFS